MQVNPNTSPIEPFGVQFDLAQGVMRDSADQIVRKASDMRGYYANEGALERLIVSNSDPIHYETFESQVPAEHGHIKFCISKLYPGVVGEECFMTKGHYHTVLETSEVYLCLKGGGLMMMKLTDETCRCQEFAPGRMVYVPPCWAHRSVNTGDEPLILLCLYPGDSGHDYGDIKTQGFPKRVFQRNGQVVVE